jgi:16S rRNA (guanine527-N7)-methyltransferase
MAPLTADDFAKLANGSGQIVSRETMDRLAAYLALLEKWNRAINLVSKATLADPWRRHLLDSAQLQPHLPEGPATVLDLGSGAGFPGLVLAILGGERLTVHLVESDARKAAFLREAARVADVAATVHNRRIEDLQGFGADVVTARALAPIAAILDLAAPFMAEKTQLLLLKGTQTHKELTDAQKNWTINTTLHPSRSDPSGFIVQITEARRHDPPGKPGKSG